MADETMAKRHVNEISIFFNFARKSNRLISGKVTMKLIPAPFNSPTIVCAASAELNRDSHLVESFAKRLTPIRG